MRALDHKLVRDLRRLKGQVATIALVLACGSYGKVTSTFHGSDMLKQVQPNGNTVDFEYYLDGSTKHQVEKTGAGTVVAEHTLDYNANGNPSSPHNT